MKKITVLLIMLFAFTSILSGCAGSSEPNPSEQNNSPSTQSQSEAGANEEHQGTEQEASNTETAELMVQFGDSEAFVLHLEDNSTAQAIAGHVGTTQWRLPVYSYDESDVMEYYDIPSRYEIPDNSETVTEAHAGDVFYSDPNRIVLYYHDAQINEEYTLVGHFDATEEFVSAVENNPVLEGWGIQIVVISTGE